MKHRVIQYIFIITILSAITGGWFYFSSDAAQKINASKVNNLTNGLVGYWTFDGADMTATQATDKAGSNNGTINGTVTKNPGKIGQGLDFNGSNGYLNNAGSPNLNITDVTECAWIYPKSVSGGQVIMHYANATDGDNVGLRINSQGAGILDVFDGNDARILSNTALAINNWYHICATIGVVAGPSNDSFKIYINGSLDNSNTAYYNPWTGEQGLQIGARINPNQYFNGSIDEVRIYNKALTQSEITELYQQGQTKINASQVNKLTNGLTGYWSFDGADVNWTGASAGTVTNTGSLGGTLTMNNLSQSASPIVGKVGQGLNFNAASSQYIKGTTQIRDLFGSRVGTLSAWIRPTGAPMAISGYEENMPGAITEDNNGGFGIFRGNFEGSGDKIWATNGWEQTAKLSFTFNLGEWVHVIWRLDDTNACLYKNGVQSSCTPHSSRYSAGPINIGRGFLNYFNGDIDEVRTYSRALTESEITELYQQGQTKINASQTGKLTNGLVGYWTFDGADTTWVTATTGTVTDKSGNNRTGTLNNMSQSTDPKIGKIGQALYFDGSNNNIDMGDNFDFEVNNAFSASFWAKFENSAGPIIYKWGWGCTEGWYIGLSSGKMGISFDGASGVGCGQVGIIESTVPALGIWYHYAITYDGSKTTGGVKIYRDATEGQSVWYSSGFPDSMLNDLPLRVGANSRPTPTGFFNRGMLDEVRIYNRVLSQSEVTELYNMGR